MQRVSWQVAPHRKRRILVLSSGVKTENRKIHWNYWETAMIHRNWSVHRWLDLDEGWISCCRRQCQVASLWRWSANICKKAGVAFPWAWRGTKTQKNWLRKKTGTPKSVVHTTTASLKQMIWTWMVQRTKKKQENTKLLVLVSDWCANNLNNSWSSCQHRGEELSANVTGSCARSGFLKVSSSTTSACTDFKI